MAERRRLARTISIGSPRARGERRQFEPQQVAAADAGHFAWWPSGGLVILGDEMHGEIDCAT